MINKVLIHYFKFKLNKKTNYKILHYHLRYMTYYVNNKLKQNLNININISIIKHYNNIQYNITITLQFLFKL